MKKQGVNPYLPSWEYVPDAEPHVFGDRVYIYGSHDRFNGYAYCLNDYVCWSAPVSDISDWRYEGMIYGKMDDPGNRDGEMCLYAPDVVKGNDGKFYLYYVLDKLPVVSVAVCDTPAGKYEFYGYVHHEDGILLGRKEGEQPQFDPGVMAEGCVVYLYTGFCRASDASRRGSMVTVLKEDMLTVKKAPRTLVPSAPYGRDSGYEGHEFFEASSIRKVNGMYYFIYSSVVCHELCYAVSKYPDRDFTYGGVIVSNNDIGLERYRDCSGKSSGRKASAKPMYYGGNNHGSIVEIQGQWYIFYHRHTNGTNFSRQACLEKIEILPDGSIPQVEMTSCGPNGGPLEGRGEYPAYLACNLFGRDEAAYTAIPGEWMDCRFPKITQDGKDQDEEAGYIANMRNQAVAGFKYFDCRGIRRITVKVRGGLKGAFEVMTEHDGAVLGSIPVGASNEWKSYTEDITVPDGIRALYFRYIGEKGVSMASFTLE